MWGAFILAYLPDNRQVYMIPPLPPCSQAGALTSGGGARRDHWSLRAAQNLDLGSPVTWHSRWYSIKIDVWENVEIFGDHYSDKTLCPDFLNLMHVLSSAPIVNSLSLR